MEFKLEEHINDWVKEKFDSLKLKNQIDFFTESAIPDYLKDALRGRAKTENRTNFGKPDFSLTKYKIPVIIENKLGSNKLISENKGIIKFDNKSISGYAVNGALYYATGIVASAKYHEVIAVAIAGDSISNIKLNVYYVYGSGERSFKYLNDVQSLDFLENENSFNEFYDSAILTEHEKHEILINSQASLQKYAKNLNKLMHNLNITAAQRVLYVSGMLLSMQPVIDKNGVKIQDGLIPDDLKGIQSNSKRDGVQIVNQIAEFLKARDIPYDKQELMLSSFYEISKDSQRDEKIVLESEVATLINSEASTSKQIFTFIYKNIFLSIDAMAGHLDIMGEMYSEFLKYALGDGKEIGIVLTPPYITKMMASILNVDKDSKVMDLATGSAGFLISAMDIMIEHVESMYGKKTSLSKQKIAEIKEQQLLGVELNAEMYTLAATNMVLRGDGSSNILKGNTFNTPSSVYDAFKATILLLNPPFSYTENGMPFIAFGLDRMEKGGLGAIIIQDSAGSGKAVNTNKSILKKHTLLASIKMPMDLFQPMAGVQTSIYIFEAHRPHDYDKPVKFIDFRNDGYKRGSRALHNIDEPSKRYSDIIKIYKAGKNAKVEASWDLDSVYIEDFITNSGKDWNFEKHKNSNKKVHLDDFKKTISDYLLWDIDRILKESEIDHDAMQNKIEILNNQYTVAWSEYTIDELFDIRPTKNYGLSNRDLLKSTGNIPVVSNTSINNGITAYVDLEPTEQGNVITFSDTTSDDAIFYQPKDFVGYSHIQCLHKKFDREIGEKVYLFIVTAFRHAVKGKYNYGSKFNRKNAAKEKITLPTIDGKISFEYIEGFIELLQKERLSRLQNYLANTLK
ncbi:N-6 DNA methylase [Serratia silvae]|uniref:site-specific DNA-methyltransferase (adenine-specific) n=2 Tax=Serratia silvae TaxID=2824122 RepID=A0ABT0K7W4_9GAMM|nr:N-6 DNA methylase [Serratia silvae]MCL1028115.1 N-6 DNA methylase [Serratia silvae]